MFAHVGALVAMASSLPQMSTSEDVATDEQRYEQRHFMVAVADFEETPKPTPPGGEPASCGCEGALGDPTSAVSDQRYGVAGPAANPDPHLARMDGRHVYPNVGPGIRASDSGADDAPNAPWGRDDSLGTDPVSAQGGMWGERIAPDHGEGGVGKRDDGEGARYGSGWSQESSHYGYRCRMP